MNMTIPHSHIPTLRQRFRRTVGVRAYAFLLKLRAYSSLTPFEQFIRDGYSQVLERNLQLSTDSVVLDFGGYVGDVSWNLHTKHRPRIHIFEPVPQFVKILKTRFIDCDNVVIHSFALADRDRKEIFGLGAAGTGKFMNSAETVEVEFRSASSFISELPNTADVAIINIEGGEFDLIPCLHSCGFLRRIKRLLIQFHGVGEDPVRSRDQCRMLLSIDHKQDWNYDFVWESWSLKTAPTP